MLSALFLCFVPACTSAPFIHKLVRLKDFVDNPQRERPKFEVEDMIKYQAAFNKFQRGPNALSIDEILEVQNKDAQSIQALLTKCGVGKIQGAAKDVLYSLLEVRPMGVLCSKARGVCGM